MPTLKAECKKCEWKGRQTYTKRKGDMLLPSRHGAEVFLIERHNSLNPDCRATFADLSATFQKKRAKK